LLELPTATFVTKEIRISQAHKHYMLFLARSQGWYFLYAVHGSCGVGINPIVKIKVLACVS
jgi:hypothetical protein